MVIKVLNLYAGIGGNRKLWKGVKVTAVENNPKIAEIYKSFFPKDKMIVSDAHQFLLEHFEEFDFIWSSPPCQSHTSFAKIRALSDDYRTGNYDTKPKYADMSLYQEIVFLMNFCKCPWVVENVTPYYKPLIQARKIQRHLFWSNFFITKIGFEADNISNATMDDRIKITGFDIRKYDVGQRKDQILRNCVKPELGLHVFKAAFRNKQTTLRSDK